MHTRSDGSGPAVEIVHESLIRSWPLLRRWIDEDKEAAAFLEHLRNTARQWAAKGRPQGLLWTGDAEEEARYWSRNIVAELPALEREYLAAVLALEARARRRRRWIVGGVIAVLALVAAGALVAVFRIRQAEQHAIEEARLSRRAERRIKEQLELITRTERGRQAALVAATEGKKRLQGAQDKLKRSYSDLEQALDRAEAEKARAEAARQAAQESARRIRELADAESKARATAEQLLARERERLRKLEQRITTELR